MIRDVVGRLGDWFLIVDLDRAPAELVEGLDYFDHVAVFPGPVPGGVSDSNLPSALYNGVVRDIARRSDRVLELAGAGMAVWLGDEDGKGAVFETAVAFTSATFAETIRGLLPDAVTEGTLSSTPSDLFTGSFRFTDPRTAIDYVCGLYDCQYRVNPDGTLDAGPADELFTTTPAAVIARRGEFPSGDDPTYRTAVGLADVESDGRDLTTRVLMLASPEDDTAGVIATGSADAASVPYLDIHGNTVERTRIVEELGTSLSNADGRAQLQLNRFTNPRVSHALVVADYDLEGDFRPGDNVWVYDPLIGIVGTDADAPIQVQGRHVLPESHTVQAVQYPVTDDMSVWHRSKSGVWTDISRHVAAEQGSATIEVGELPRSSVGDYGRVHRAYDGPDTIGPAAPSITSATPTRELDAMGVEVPVVDLVWVKPANTDASTFDDGLHYVIRYKPSAATNFDSLIAPIDVLASRLEGLKVDTLYDIEIAAVDTAGNASPWASTTANTGLDNAAPSKPAAGTVAASALRLLVTMSMRNSFTGKLEDDLDHFEVHVSSSSGFSPSSSTLEATVAANRGHIELDLPVHAVIAREDDSTAYVKHIAVDKTGNKSVASDQYSASADLIDTAHIADAAIGTAQIQNASISNAKIASLSADKLTAGTINASVITVTNITASNIESGTLNASQVSIVNLSASNITTGTLNGNNVSVTNLNASNINAGTLTVSRLQTSSITPTYISYLSASDLTSGTMGIARLASSSITPSYVSYLSASDVTTGGMSAARLTSGSINASTISVTNISASNITTGNMSADRITTGSMSAQRITSGSMVADRIAGGSLGTTGSVGTIYLSGVNIYGTSGSLGTSGGFLANGNIQTFGTVITAADILASSGTGYLKTSGTQRGGWGSSGVFASLSVNAAGVRLCDAGFGYIGKISSRTELKENIVDLDGPESLRLLKALRPVSFNFKQSAIGDGTNELVPFQQVSGFLAEHTADVAHNLAVHGWPDAPLGDEGRRQSKIEDTVPVDWDSDAVLATTIAAVQLLSDRIDKLTADRETIGA